MSLSEKFEFKIIFTNESTYEDQGFINGHIEAKYLEDLQNARLFLRTEADVVYNFKLEKKVRLSRSRLCPKVCEKQLVFTETKFIGDINVRANDVHTYKFCINSIPDQLPTYVGQYGFISYKASVLLETALNQKGRKTTDNNKNVIDDERFVTREVAYKYYKVASKLNLSFVPEAATRIDINRNIFLGSCISNKNIRVNWSVEQSGYVLGDTIDVVTTVTPHENCHFRVDDTVLYQVVEYNPGYVKQYVRTEVVRAVVDNSIQKNKDIIVNEKLTLPKDLICSTTRCKKCWIDVYYEIEFSLSSKSLRKAIKEKAELYIGTEPLNLRDLMDYLSITYNLKVKDSLSRALPPSPMVKLLTRRQPSAPPPYSEQSPSSPTSSSTTDLCLTNNPVIFIPNYTPKPEISRDVLKAMSLLPEYEYICARVNGKTQAEVKVRPRNAPFITAPSQPPSYDL